MSGPLEGIRVVDFSRVLAGPLCAQTLLDLGAEVIKVEPPTPDVSRSSFPFKEGMSGYYAQQNAGKRNVSIDLNVAGARDLALRLCDTADIVVENFRPGTLGFFGLAYETLAQRNPGLIYASISGYGQRGPWRARMAYAPTVQAEAGFTENSIRHYGKVLLEPRTDSLSHADVYAGLQAVIAILAALHRRKSTGRGQYIDVAMAATLMAVNERAHLDLSDDEIGAEPAALGAMDCPFFRGPHGEQFTVATSIVGSLTFPSYMRAMRRPDLIDDSRFATAAARRQNLAALHAIIQAWIMSFSDVATLDAQFDEAKIAFGEIRSIRALSESDWSDDWGAVREVPDRYGGSYRLPGNPWRFSAEDLKPPGAPAFQGEHNRSVLAELGLTEEEIGRHVASGAVVSHVPAGSPQLSEPSGAGNEKDRGAGAAALSYRVFTSEPIPYADGAKTPNGEPHVISSISSTLISGQTDAVLVDPPMTIEQAERVAAWVHESGKRLKHIFITHGHGDHWFGTATLLRRFPNTTVFAAAGTIDVMRLQASPDFRAQRWDKNFPGQIGDTPVTATAPPGNTFDLEGNELRIVDVGHSDTDKTSVLHVPSIGLVVAGDVVYNGYHQYLAESANGGIRAWMKALDKVAALQPRNVVAGHRNKDLGDDPKAIEETRRYLEDAERVIAKSKTAREYYDAMIKLYPDRLNPGVVWFWGAQALSKS